MLRRFVASLAGRGSASAALPATAALAAGARVSATPPGQFGAAVPHSSRGLRGTARHDEPPLAVRLPPAAAAAQAQYASWAAWCTPCPQGWLRATPTWLAKKTFSPDPKPTKADAVAKALHTLEKLGVALKEGVALKQRAAEAAADDSVVLDVYVGVLAAVREAAGLRPTAREGGKPKSGARSRSAPAASVVITQTALAERIAGKLAAARLGKRMADGSGDAHQQPLFVLVVSICGQLKERASAGGPLAAYFGGEDDTITLPPTHAACWALAKPLAKEIARRVARVDTPTPSCLQCAEHRSAAPLYADKVPTVAIDVCPDKKAPPQLFKRYVPLQHRPLTNGALNFAAKPTIIVGSSGSGKSHLMVTHRLPALVVHVVGLRYKDPKNLATMTDAAKTKVDEWLKGRVRNGTERAARKLLEEYYKALGDDAKARLVAKWRFTASEQEHFAPPKAKAPGVVRVVLDEVGSERALLRSYVRTHDQLREEVAKILNFPVAHVELVAGGTGSQDPHVPYGSSPPAYDVKVADELLRKDARAVLRKIRDTVMPPDGGKHAKLARSAVLELEWTTAWAHVAGIATNMRGAAMALRYARYRWSTAGRVQSIPGMPESRSAQVEQAKMEDPAGPERWQHAVARLQVLAMDVLRTFRKQNGMQELSSKELMAALADALCIDVWGFDFIRDKEREGQLVQKYGVLVDRAQWVTATAASLKGKREIGTRRAKATGGAKKEVLAVPDDGRGRFVVPAAYAAMFAAELSSSGARAAGHAEFLEHAAAEGLAVACVLTPVDASLAPMRVAHTQLAMRGEGIPEAERKRCVSKGNYTFFGRLVPDARPRRVTLPEPDAMRKLPQPDGGCVTVGSVSKCVPFTSSHQFRQPSDKNAPRRSPPEPYSPHLVQPASPSAASAVVYVNAPRAPYADVLCSVFGKDGTLIEAVLTQTKRNAKTEQLSTKALLSEVVKTGLVDEVGAKALEAESKRRRPKQTGAKQPGAKPSDAKSDMNAAVRAHLEVAYAGCPVLYTLLLAQCKPVARSNVSTLEKVSKKRRNARLSTTLWPVPIDAHGRIIITKEHSGNASRRSKTRRGGRAAHAHAATKRRSSAGRSEHDAELVVRERPFYPLMTSRIAAPVDAGDDGDA